LKKTPFFAILIRFKNKSKMDNNPETQTEVESEPNKAHDFTYNQAAIADLIRFSEKTSDPEELEGEFTKYYSDKGLLEAVGHFQELQSDRMYELAAIQANQSYESISFVELPIVADFVEKIENGITFKFKEEDWGRSHELGYEVTEMQGEAPTDWEQVDRASFLQELLKALTVIEGLDQKIEEKLAKKRTAEKNKHEEVVKKEQAKANEYLKELS
jgi:hypothetical protein